MKRAAAVRSLGKTGIFDLLRWGPMAVADFVAEFFETELLRAAIAARGIFGAIWGRGPQARRRVLLLRAAADSHPVGSAAFPRGGLGEFSRALAEAAKAAGAEIRTNAEVQQIRTKSGAVSGVVLADGEEIACEAVVSGVDPKRTFLQVARSGKSGSRFRHAHEEFPHRGAMSPKCIWRWAICRISRHWRTPLVPMASDKRFRGGFTSGMKSITWKKRLMLRNMAKFPRRRISM